MVEMVITNLGLPNAPGPDGISVVVLKYFEPELPHVLANLFSKCPNESCFQDGWRVWSVVPIFKNIGEGSTVKNYYPVNLFSGW